MTIYIVAHSPVIVASAPFNETPVYEPVIKMLTLHIAYIEPVR